MSIALALTSILFEVPTTSITPDEYVKPSPATEDFNCNSSAEISIPPVKATLTSSVSPFLLKPFPAIKVPEAENNVKFNPVVPTVIVPSVVSTKPVSELTEPCSTNVNIPEVTSASASASVALVQKDDATT